MVRQIVDALGVDLRRLLDRHRAFLSSARRNNQRERKRAMADTLIEGWWGVLITWQDVLTAWRAVEASADTPEAQDEAKRVWRAALDGWKAAQAAHFGSSNHRRLHLCPDLEP